MHPLIIYLATCSVNDKRYVGQTVQTLPTRISNHRNDAASATKQCNQPFIAAIRKHGIAAFTFVEIDRADSQEELDYMERYWIRFHRTTDRRYGYNVQLGGQCRRQHAPGAMQKGVRCKETGEAFHSMAAAARAKSVSPAAMTLHMNGTHATCAGCHWEWTGNAGAAIYDTSAGVQATFRKTSERQRVANRGPRAGVRCVETGETFTSLTEAGRRYGMDKRAVYTAVERGIIAGGVHWERTTPKRKHNPVGTRRCAVKAIETGAVYSSLATAATALGLKTGSSIWCAIRRNQTAGGYHWAYA